jgi:hypothetical protein
MPNVTPRFGVAFVPKAPKIQTKEVTMPNNNDWSTHTRDQVGAIFGPGSDSRKAADLARRDPALYNSLKQAAVYSFSLLPEEMLNRASRIKKEDREAAYRAAHAAAKDNLIPLPNELADRLGVPWGTRVTYEQLQKSMGKQPI